MKYSSIVGWNVYLFSYFESKFEYHKLTSDLDLFQFICVYISVIHSVCVCVCVYILFFYSAFSFVSYQRVSNLIIWILGWEVNRCWVLKWFVRFLIIDSYGYTFFFPGTISFGGGRETLPPDNNSWFLCVEFSCGLLSFYWDRQWHCCVILLVGEHSFFSRNYSKFK